MQKIKASVVLSSFMHLENSKKVVKIPGLRWPIANTLKYFQEKYLVNLLKRNKIDCHEMLMKVKISCLHA